MPNFATILKDLRNEHKLTQTELADKLGLSFSTISMYERGEREPKNLEVLETIADFFNVSIDYICGKTSSKGRLFKDDTKRFPEPTITEEYTTFPVIGEIAAGFDHTAIEDWDGDTIDIPDTCLRGHDKSDFFVLRIKGNSMYPEYKSGDKVLILKQPTMNYSGEVGAVMYGDDCGTLKIVKYPPNKEWIELAPINPNVEPIRLDGEALENFRVVGIPKMLVREID